MESLEELDWEREEAYRFAPELVFGLVGSVGVKLGRVAQQLETALRQVNYDSVEVRLSNLLHSLQWADDNAERLPDDRDGASRDVDITMHQDAGDRLRRLTKRGDALAVLALIAIRRRRAEATRAADEAAVPLPSAADSPASGSPQLELSPQGSSMERMFHMWQRQSAPALPRTAFVLRSLKHPDEAATLRKVYGRRFHLIAAHLPGENAIDDLARQIAASEQVELSDKHRQRARDLYDREADPDKPRPETQSALTDSEDDPDNDFGQNVRDTYRHADCFVDVNGDTDFIFNQLKRYVHLVFGDAFVTPTSDELGMKHAYVASLRSSALGRQVGAAITDDKGSVIATGTNEVPKAHGGHYWPGDKPDGRDFAYHDGDDSSDLMRRSILREILDRLERVGLYAKGDGEELVVDELVAIMKTARVWRLTEFGRPVHAEMSAITDAARRGVALNGAMLYTTTYPCHGCARHILSAGIRRVTYVEPYAKSLTHNLHEDALERDVTAAEQGRVPFVQFIGVTPQRFDELFARSSAERKDAYGKAKFFEPDRSVPLHVEPQPFYQLSEYTTVLALRRAMEGKVGIISADTSK